jgi:hypothetical protein
MKQMSFIVLFSAMALLTACSGGSRKVVVMASGKVTVSEDQKKVKLEPGTTHTEKEIILSGTDATQIDVESPDGSKTFDIKDAGSYVLNLKKDTLVGGIIRYGAAMNNTRLGMEELEKMIDSTRQLMSGQNASDANKSYFIPPFTLKKISDNQQATLIGPYNNIPGSVKVDKDGNGPETYKFFTNKQKQESLDDLIEEMKK